jgi:hypothetical protein
MKTYTAEQVDRSELENESAWRAFHAAQDDAAVADTECDRLYALALETRERFTTVSLAAIGIDITEVAR